MGEWGEGGAGVTEPVERRCPLAEVCALAVVVKIAPGAVEHQGIFGDGPAAAWAGLEVGFEW